MFDFYRLLQALRKLAGNAPWPARPETAQPSGGSARADDTGQLVLVVDDQRTNRTLLVRLINMLGYAAEATENGATALKKWNSGRFALVITDCHMAEMDGYELTRNIRRIETRGGRRRMPIIAWTSTVVSGANESWEAAGMDDRLPKPVELETLAGMLARWLPPPGKPLLKPTAEAATPAHSGITLDRSVLARYSSGDPDQEREILRDFRAANSADIVLFERALAQRDPLLAAQAAHRIKGASRMIGAHAFAAACEHIEKSGRARDWNAIAAHQETFFRELRKLNDTLNSC